jgi:hypothetical protein
MDKSLFPRLKRLFSTDVIIRNVGGTSLKVIDIDKIQSFGLVQTSNLTDRFVRLHKAGARMQYNPTLNYQTLRLQLYSDYEAMDTDPIVAACLDIIAGDATGKSETGEMLSIKSSNENIQSILYNLFYDVLNIKFNLPMWIRALCKYGDFYLKLQIAEKFGVYNVNPFSVYDIIREEGLDPENPAYVCFRVDPTALAGGTAGLYDKEKYENYEVAHFRMTFDPNMLPYGRSYLEPARKLFKQMVLLEDAVLLHRISRSADKRIFYVNVGNIPPNEVDNAMQKVIQSMRRTPYVDENTGDYNLKYNVQNMIEDYFIPVRGNDVTTKIETAPGLQYSGMDDVAYMRDKMLAALKVPKDRLNYTEDINGKSTLAGIGINFSRTIEYVQDIVLSELRKIALIHLYTQGFEEADMDNFELSLTIPSIIYKQEKIALLKEQIDLARQAFEGKILSSDWVMSNIFDMSEDQILQERELLVEDQKRAFRFEQIATEGNDPVITGESYGTPHDLASLYGQTRYSKPDVPDGYDENEPGRPKEKASTIGTDDSPHGRDPLGKKDTLEPYHPGKPTQQQSGNGPFKLEEQSSFIRELQKLRSKPRRIVLYENTKKQNEDDDYEGILSESTIIDIS